MANKTVTVKGSGGDYTTFAGAIAGELIANPDLTSMAGILTIELYASAAPDNSGTTSLDSFITSTDYYIDIVVPEGERSTDGIFSTSKYYLQPPDVNYTTPISINGCDYIHIDGVQFTGNTTDIRNSNCIIWFNNSIKRIRIKNVIVENWIGSSSSRFAFNSNNNLPTSPWGADEGIHIDNCVINNATNGIRNFNGNVYFSGFRIRNCTITNSVYFGIQQGTNFTSSTTDIKNCLVYGSGVADFDEGGNGFYDCRNNADSDGSAVTLETGGGSTCITLSSENFDDFVSSPPDLDISGGWTEIDDEGVGPGSDSYVLTTDIVGTAREGTTCSIGAFEYVGLPAVSYILKSFLPTFYRDF